MSSIVSVFTKLYVLASSVVKLLLRSPDESNTNMWNVAFKTAQTCNVMIHYFDSLKQMQGF